MSPTLGWLKRLIASVASGSDTDQQQAQRENTFPRLYDTRLEERRVLNSGAVVSASDLLALQFDAGQSANDGIADKFELARVESAPGQIAVSINDQRVWQGDASQVQSIRFDGSTDVDSFIIDASIALPQGLYISGNSAADGEYLPSSGDIVVLATADDRSFDEVTYQTTDYLTQVRLAAPLQQSSSLIQISNVNSIVDSVDSNSRSFLFESNESELRFRDALDLNHNSDSPSLELSTGRMNIEFSVPNDHLRIESRALGQSQGLFAVESAQLNPIRSVELLGNDQVTIRQSGSLSIGDSLAIRSGNVEVTGNIDGDSSNIELDASRRILLANGSSVTTRHGSVIASANDITVSGQISTGAEGLIDIHASRAAIIDGKLLSTGNAIQRGGTVRVTGDEVTLGSTAIVDTSGGVGGGTIRVGGGYRGNEVGIRNARQTIVERGATLNADAVRNGDGGSIVVWANDSTYVYDAQTITARGGALSGDGGFIETSGKHYLFARGSASTYADNGEVGTWLIDPDSILIVNAAGPVIANTSYYLISDIVNSLASTNLVIATTTVSGGVGDITIVDAVALAPGASRTLTLTATRDIIFQNSLSGNSNLQVVLNAGRDVNSSAVSLGQMGSLTISANEKVVLSGVNLAGGSLTVNIDADNNQSAQSLTALGAISASSITINGTNKNDTASFSGSLTSTTGSIQFSSIDTISFSANVLSASSITFTNVDGPLTLGGGVNVTSGSGSLDFSTIAAGINLSGNNGTTNSITANGATGSLTLAAVTTTNSNVSLSLSSSTSITANDINLQTGALNAQFNTQNTAGSNVASFQHITSGSLTISGNSQVNDNVKINGAITSSGSVLIQNFKDLDILANIIATSSITITGTATANTHLSASITSSGGNIAITGGMLLVEGGATRNIKSGGAAVNVATGGSITIGGIDGEVSAATLSIDSRGSTTAGAVNIGDVTATGTGLNKLTIRTDSTTRGQVTINDIRLVRDATTSSTLSIASNGLDIIANGDIDLSSQNSVDGGSVDFGTSRVIPVASNSNISINTSSSGGNGGDITLKGIANNGANYFDRVVIDTTAPTVGKTAGDLNFSNTTDPSIAADATTGTGIRLSGTILKSFLGTFTLNTNPGNVAQNTSDIDVSTADFQTALGLKFDTSNGGTATNAGDVYIGDIGVVVAQRPSALTVDTRGTVSNGSMIVNNNVAGTTQVHINGTLNTTRIALADDALIQTYSNSSMTLGTIVLATATPFDLTLNSQANISLTSLQIGSGDLSATIDSNSNQANAFFQSSGAMSAGSMTFTGTSTNDNVTFGGSVSTSLAAIQFSNLDDITFLGSVSSATSITFTNINGQLVLGNNVSVATTNGSLDLSPIAGGILLNGPNGTSNSITANGATAALTLADITTTNTIVSLVLNSATSITAADIALQSGSLTALFNTSNNTNSNTASFQLINSGTLSINGNSQVNDNVILNDVVNSDSSVSIANYKDLIVAANITAAGSITTTGISNASTHLRASLTSSGGNIAITGGVLLVDGTATRNIKSGGASLDVATGGSITIGDIDGESSAATLSIDSRGSTTAGAVTIGDVTAAGTGVNLLTIRTDSTNRGQVTIHDVRLVRKAPTTAALTVSSNGLDVIADGVIDLSSSTTANGGSIDFGNSRIIPLASNSILTLNTSSVGGNGGDITLGGIANNGTNYFDRVVIDTTAPTVTKTAGDLNFSSTSNPSISADATTGTGIRLAGTILKSFSGNFSLSTNPGGVAQNTSDIDITDADFQTTLGLKFDTSNLGTALNAGDVLIGDLGISALQRPNSLTVDTRGATSNGALVVNNKIAGTTQIHVNGTIDTTGVSLADDALIQSYNNSSMNLGAVSLASATPFDLTLNSHANVQLTSLQIGAGDLSVTIDSNNNQSNAFFQSTAAMSAGSMTFTGFGSNDDITLGGTVTTTSGSIGFSTLDDITFNGSVTSGTTITFATVSGPLVLGTGVNVTTNSGAVNFSPITNGIRLAGTDGSTNTITATGATGSITLAPVAITNNNVSLILNSSTSLTAADINLKAGSLTANFNTVGSTSNHLASFGLITASNASILGGSQTNDSIDLNGAVNVSNTITISGFNDLAIDASVTSGSNLTITGISGSKTHLAADLVSNGGNISVTGGTMFVDGGAARSIKSGGAAQSVASGGSIQISAIDGENGAGDLTIDSRGSSSAGTVTLGNVTAATSGLNRLTILTNATTAAQVQLNDVRLVGKSPSTASALVVNSAGLDVVANGTLDLSGTTINGGSIDFGSSKLTPTAANSTLSIKTNSTSGDGGDITLGGIANNGTNYFDQVTIDTNASNAAKIDGDLSFNGITNPVVAVDGTTGSGITLIGAIIKSFTGILSFLTNPLSAFQTTSKIDVSQSSINVAGGLRFDTSGGNTATTAGNVVLGDIGVTTPVQSLTVDTRGSTASGLLKLNDGVVASTTDLRSTGNIDLTDTTTELGDNAFIESSGAGASIYLGSVTTTGSAQNLQLRSNENINITGSANLNGGTFTANIDFDNDQTGATFQSTNGISAGSIVVAGSAAGNDDVSIATGPTASTTQSTTGSIAFQNVRTLTLQHLLKSKTTISGTNVGKVVLNSSAIVEAENDIDLRTSIGQIELAGADGTTNTIRTITGNGSISLASVSTSNVAPATNVSLALQSRNSVTASAIELHSGALSVTFDNSLTNATATATFSTINAGTLSIAGNSRVNDKIVLNGNTTIGNGGVSLTQYNELAINAPITTNGSLTATGITGSVTRLAANVTTNGGSLAITGGTLLVNGSSTRQLTSGGGGAVTGGAITLGTIDGEVSAAELEINSRGTTTAGSVTLGTIQITGANKGLNRLLIDTASTNAGQVSLSDTRLVHNGLTPASLTVSANGRGILANGTIDLSSSAVGQSGGSVIFGTSIVTPKTGSSTLVINTSNTNASSGADGSNGGNITFGGVGTNGGAYFNSVTLDARATDPLDSSGTIHFLGSVSPSVAVDGLSGTGISIFGNVNNAAGTVLSFLTNPANANQTTSAIDVSRATFVGTGGLVFDTSGGNHATTAGSVSLGDLGVTIRPISLTVDTRGTSSTGLLILNDNVGASTTELHVDGSINLTNTALQLADNVLIQSHGDGNNITLGSTNVTGGARNLTLISDNNITIGSVSLSGGTLSATIDANANNTPSLFQALSTINVGTLSVTGNAVQDDLATFAGSITTTAAVNIVNFNQVDLNGALVAGTAANISGISGALRLGTNASIRANDTIALRTLVNSIVLSGITGSTNTIEAHGASSSVNLGPITTIAPGVNLIVQSDYNVLMDSAVLTDGVLTVTFGAGNAHADASASFANVTAKGLSVTGTDSTTDSILLNGPINVGTTGLIAQQVGQLDINASVQSSGVITANNVTSRIRLADSVSLIADGIVNMQTGVSSIQLLGANGSLNLIRSNSDAGTLRLGAVTTVNNVNMQVESANSADLSSIDLGNGALQVSIDTNNNSNTARLDSGSLRAGQLNIAGSLTANDVAVINGALESRVANIAINSFGTLTLNQNVTSATNIQVGQIANRVDIGTGRTIQANNGDVNMIAQVGSIRFIGGAATTSSIRSINGNLNLAAVTEQSTSSLIDLRADRDVQLTSAALTTALQIVAGDNSSPLGTINSAGTIATNALTLEAATGIGTITPLTTSTNTLAANNRLTGDIRILNNKSGSVTVSSLTAHSGGNIDLQNSGGSTLRINNASTAADATPAINEANIHVQNVGGNLIVEGTGISAGGLGGVNLETVGTGDVQLDATILSLGGPTTLFSSQKIVGTSPITAASIDLQATTGIGGISPVQTRTTQLEATTTTGIINVANTSSNLVTVSNLATDVSGSVSFRQTGGGDLNLARASTGSVPSLTGSNIIVSNDAGSILVQGNTVAGGTGSILLTASNNLILAPTSTLETEGSASTIHGNAGGQFQLQPGAIVRAGTSNPATEASISRLPPLVQVRPVVNFLGVNVDSLGVASIQLQLGGPSPAIVDKNFSVIIDWGDGQIDTLPNGPLSTGTINPNITRFDASGTVYQITHQYLGNPNPNDPIAKIPVRVTVGVDALNRIQFNDSLGANANLVQVVDENFEVPAAGLFSLRFDIPQTPSVPNRLVFNTSLAIANPATATAATKPADILTSSSDSSAEQERSYVLRIVTPIDEQGGVSTSEDIELTEEDIDDLSRLFQRLGDNRYRIYLIREDGVRLMLKDFYLRDHRPIEIEDSQEPTAETANDRILEKTGPAAMQRPDESMMNAAMTDDETVNTPQTEKVSNAASAGVALSTVRSWRKAARRFRAS